MNTPTRIGASLAKAGVNPTPNSVARNAKAKKDLIEAEQLLAKRAGAQQRRFIALYRIRDPDSPTKGSSDERREHLIARFEGLNGHKRHVSTSAWSLWSYHATRERVLAALTPAIDVELDYLEVAITGDPVHAGVSKLKN